MESGSILIVDDDTSVRTSLAESLEFCGYDVERAVDGKDALSKFQKKTFDVVITDVRMPGMNGMEVLRCVKTVSSHTPVIVITAYGTVNTAVEAMKEGASDFIMKPFLPDHLELVVKNVVSNGGNGKKRTRKAVREYLSPGKKIITRDESMLSLMKLMKNVSKSKSSILIQGESGTGKELFARYIHRQSDRADGPFIAVNCAAIPYNLLESEMFGYEKGAFTGASLRKVGKFEMANGGTLLLDEISEMDIRLQAKLLRVIQESEVDRLGSSSPVAVDTRIIATTNAALKERVVEKKFRDDLYYRLNVISVRIPPLRERKADIGLLSEYFLDKYSRLNGIEKPDLSKEVVAVLVRYAWPGNVRELENVIERSVLMCDGLSIVPKDLYLDEIIEERGAPATNGAETTSLKSDTSQDLTLREYEKRLIFETLKEVRGNKTRASEILGISVRTMRNKLNEYRKEECAVGG